MRGDFNAWKPYADVVIPELSDFQSRILDAVIENRKSGTNLIIINLPPKWGNTLMAHLLYRFFTKVEHRPYLWNALTREGFVIFDDVQLYTDASVSQSLSTAMIYDTHAIIYTGARTGVRDTTDRLLKDSLFKDANIMHYAVPACSKGESNWPEKYSKRELAFVAESYAAMGKTALYKASYLQEVG